MKRELLVKSCCISLIGLITIFGCVNSRTRDTILKYGTGTWEPDTLGNHRIVLRVSHPADAVRAEIMWRRRDHDPDKKMMILIDANTGEQVLNILCYEMNRESGKIVFRPESGPGNYYLYCLPYIIRGRNYPKVTYPGPENMADPAWIARTELVNGEITKEQWGILPEADVIEMQSIDEFNSFYPMEVIATKSEMEDLLSELPEPDYLLFPEDRKYPIRMTGDLPFRWIEKGPGTEYRGESCINEYFTFQIGLYAAKTNIGDAEITFTDLKNNRGKVIIPANAITCFNKEGVNWDGKPFTKKLEVNSGKVQALWFGVDIPENANPCTVSGLVTIKPVGLPEKSIRLVLTLRDTLLTDRGDGEPWRHSRLRWLNSQLAAGEEVIAPFIPLEVKGNAIKCLGREIILDRSGLPAKYLTFFTPAVTGINDTGANVLAHPVRFHLTDVHEEPITWETTSFGFTDTNPGRVSWQSVNHSGDIRMECNGSMEPDGFLDFRVVLTSGRDIELTNTCLEIPVEKEFALYFMGLGEKGGLRYRDLSWKWDWQKNQEGAWIGNVHGGIQFGLRGDNYSRPLNTNFYLAKPLNMPDSWYNNGKGGITIQTEKNASVRIRAFSGPGILRKGEELHFNFYFLLTPFKPLDTKQQWSARFYHRFDPVDTILSTGATVVNVHHANEVNPYINYPFLHQEQMRDYIREAHEKGLKVKIYNTIRELSNHAPEIFAIRSLGHEIFSPGPGNGYSWLQEHLGDDYIAAWFVPHLKDAAIINSGMSRWHNYYIEGLDWLTRNMEIDGLYIDDVAFDRTTMKRVRKVLDRNREGALIDLHSANQYNVRDGFINSASLYMEHFPYIDRLWFGEYFNPDSPPDFWLVEMSGIPYGLMGEMLQDGGNKYRGLVYGMTARLPWAGDPRGIWKVWDEFGIGESTMTGYWSPDCPVKTGLPDILATTWVKNGECLVAVGSWAGKKSKVILQVNWDKLGIKKGDARLSAPYIEGFQEYHLFRPDAPIPVEPGKGWLLIISADQ